MQETKNGQSKFDIKNYSTEESEMEATSESQQLKLPQNLISQQLTPKYRRGGKLSEY